MFKKCSLHVHPEYPETLKTNVTGSLPSQNLISKSELEQSVNSERWLAFLKVSSGKNYPLDTHASAHGNNTWSGTMSDSLEWAKVCMPSCTVCNNSDYSGNPTSLENSDKYSEYEYNEGIVQNTLCKMTNLDS